MPQPTLVEPLRRWDPEQVGGYVLLGRLGAGAMGQVYLGRSAAGRLVAVKTIKSELAEEPDFRTRFGQEVAAARRVSGAFTAAVVAADSEADVPWLATVYVPAPSLSKLVRTCGPLPAAAVRWLAAGCAEALEAIHGVGLVHRDLKPSNVLISPDGPRVIDFGVARAAERIQLTVTRGSIGTPAYMAPEQARDTRQATSASDIFSLGATTLFAATGHAPYQGETVMDVLVRLATEPPDLAGLPAELADIVQACLERDPRGRPTSAAIVARLAPWLETSGDLGSAPLPAKALELIAEYRRTPAPAAEGRAEIAGESTLGSQPLLGDTRRDVIARQAEHPAQQSRTSMADPSAAPDTGQLGAGIPAAGELGADIPAAGELGADQLSARRTSKARPGTRAPDANGRLAPTRLRRRARLWTASVVAAVALIAAGWAVGASIASGTRPPPLGPIIQPPPGPPGSGLASAGRGAPTIAVSQPYGDSYTSFVIRGQNWPVDKPVTIVLVGVRGSLESPVDPIADRAGTFNYVVNQGREFFRGGLPVGTYTVRVTGTDGKSAQASFQVQRT